MGIFVGLVPAFAWGVQSIVMQKIGGKFTNKVVGMTMGTFLFAVVVSSIKTPQHLTGNLLLGSVLCGISWTIGQLLQVKSFDIFDVSQAMPISTGQQLVGTALFAVFYFHEWTKTWQLVLGAAAIALIIFGIISLSYSENKDAAGSSLQGLILLTISSVGFVGYAVLPRIFNLNGWEMLLPQSLAMFLCSLIYSLTVDRKDTFNKESFANILTGLCFAVANLALLFSNQFNGVAVGFTLSQLNVVIATLGGMWVLHEMKTHKEMRHTLLGLLLVVAGAIMIGLTKF